MKVFSWLGKHCENQNHGRNLEAHVENLGCVLVVLSFRETKDTP